MSCLQSPFTVILSVNKHMNDLRLLLKVSRPFYWPYLPIVFFGGMCLAGFEPKPLALLMLALLTFPYHLFVFGINDIHDYESDRRNPRKGGVMGEIVNPHNHAHIHRYVLLCGALIFLASLATLNTTTILLTSGLLLLSYYYSAPPLRLKRIPMIDSVTNGLLYVFAISLGYSYIGNPTDIPLLIYLIGLGVAGLHALSTTIDHEPDKAAGDSTFSVLLGRRPAALFCATMTSILLLVGNPGMVPLRIHLLIIITLSLFLAITPSKRLTIISFGIFLVGFFWVFVHSLVTRVL